jgi:zinc protease
MILTIAGDISSNEVSEVVGETFARIPKGELKKQRGPKEAEQKAFRFGQSSADIQQGYSVLGWHTPGVGSKDELALEVFANILGGGRSSRLYREVIAPEAASSVYAYNWPVEDIGIFFVQASFNESNRGEVDRRIVREIERFKRHGPTAYELQLAKNVIESRYILGLQSVLGQASALADAEANYGYRAMGTRLAELHRLTAEQVQAAAQRYLRVGNLTLYHYQPTDAETITAEQALAMVRATAAEAELEAEEDVPLPALPRTVASATGDTAPRELKLSNGTSLLVEERTGAPVVRVGVYFRGGRIGESSRNAGITRLMTSVMRRGTKTRTAEEIDREIEFLGTQVGSFAAADYFGFELTILGRNLVPGLELMADVVLHPSFPEDEIRRAKGLQISAIKRSFDSSSQRPIQLLYASHYGNHPYALPSNGFGSSVEMLGRDELVEWWESWVRADDALIVVVGDVGAVDAKLLVEKHFASLAERDSALAPDPALRPPQSRIQTVEYRDRKQSAIAVAFPTVAMSHEDWPALRLLQDVTTGLAGTFFVELRGNKSLAYTVYGREASRRSGGTFVGYLASDASKEKEAFAALIDEFGHLDEDGFTEQDVARAKAYFAGSTRIRLQTNASRAGRLAESWMYGLGLDFTDRTLETVRALSLQQLREIAAKYLDGDNYTTAIVSGRPDNS